MVKMKTLLISLALQPLTKLKPKIRNATRWVSTFEMVARYFRYEDDAVLRHLVEDVPAMADFMLSPGDARRLRDLKQSLEQLHQVTLVLQDPTCTFPQMRAIFAHVTATFLTMDRYIRPDAAIVHSPHFESALHKIAIHAEHTLTAEEVASVAKLRRMLPQPAAGQAGAQGGTTEFRSTSDAKFTCSVCNSFFFFFRGFVVYYYLFIPYLFVLITCWYFRNNQYPSIDWIPIGSVMCESLFSVADAVFDSRRTSTLPVHVEDQMFLKANREYWKHKAGNQNNNG